MKKSRDLQQAFDRLNKKISDFNESQTIAGLERIEIEGIIQQVNRLHDRLEKFINIVGRKFS
ncbi:MAG: hypothetical protein KAJ76_01750 [Candidatus Heimdallarchaeota archaeon]|nr:hypothetical protein [Candidatus Heimdallarchaeota archaeon]MCK5184899.1 hypothetical protein [Candidatus Heimdallarchaeota archaeon]MCK5297600.1 hypothetical protein [Candidatus Heimdallarchaeota archaeon]